MLNVTRHPESMGLTWNRGEGLAPAADIAEQTVSFRRR